MLLIANAVAWPMDKAESEGVEVVIINFSNFHAGDGSLCSIP